MSAIIAKTIIALFLAANLLGGWKYVSGPVVPGAHQHGCCTYHAWVRDGWGGAVYTCNVTYRTMRAIQAGRLSWLACLGRYGKS